MRFRNQYSATLLDNKLLPTEYYPPEAFTNGIKRQLLVVGLLAEYNEHSILNEDMTGTAAAVIENSFRW